MTRLNVTLASVLLMACTQAPNDGKATFTLSTGVRVVSSSYSSGDPREAGTQVEVEADVITVKMREYFHGAEEIKQAWLSLPRHGIATLNVGSSSTAGPFATKDESLRDVTVQIERNRLPHGTTLSVYNLDTAETLAHHLVR